MDTIAEITMKLIEAVALIVFLFVLAYYTTKAITSAYINTKIKLLRAAKDSKGESNGKSSKEDMETERYITEESEEKGRGQGQ